MKLLILEDKMELLRQLATVFDIRSVLIVALILVPLERLFALHAPQPILRRWWWNDVIYLIVNRVPITLGLTSIIVCVVALTPWLVPQALRDFVGGLALWIQLPLAVLMADLGFYSAHRLFHAVPGLWRFHAVHHSIEEMDWLAASRVHPVDQVITKGLSLTPLFMMGFSSTAVAIHGAIYLTHSYLLHSNLRVKIGPLRWIIASPEFHHWHHGNHREAWNKNFAGQLPFLDALFGTAHMPADKMPTLYGVDEAVPNTYLKQLAYPFRAAALEQPSVITSHDDFSVSAEVLQTDLSQNPQS